MPGFHVLELSAAARHDIYSKTSDPTVPKYSLRWLPFNDELAIRGSYSESFTAPTLYDLFGPVSVGFTSSINITRYNTSGTSLGVAAL
jgi:iron complex outermembrane receptor protein